jgi:hypothetical protein
VHESGLKRDPVEIAGYSITLEDARAVVAELLRVIDRVEGVKEIAALMED